ncbi:MAG TPA: lipopolysaccharide heptosyltransferase II [Candidatus Binatia bacterium]
MEASADPKSILIVLHGSIGDVTRALPLAGLLRRRFPNATIAWSVEPASEPLVERYPGVDEVIVFDRRRPWTSVWSFLREIRARRFDLVIDLQRHLKSGIISRTSGAAIRLGFHRSDAKEFNWIFNNRSIAAMGDGIPKIQHYMEFAKALGIEPEIEWQLSLTPQEILRVDERVRAIGRDFAVLFAGARWQSKQWFPDQIAGCAEALEQHYRFAIVLLGSRDDERLAAEAVARSAAPIHNWVGDTGLREAAGIISRGRVCVGPDTGLMHIAAAVGTPVVSLFGATDPVRTGPYGFGDLVIKGRAECSPCYRAECRIGRICMRSIGTEEILAKVSKALSRTADMQEIDEGGQPI